MTVKEVLKKTFERMVEYYKTTDEKYPTIPWSPSVNPIIYVGEKDKSGWTGWLPLEKTIIHDFKDIENELGVKIHEDIKEYFNSFWFMELSVRYKLYNFTMEIVPPGEEFKHIVRQWKDAKEYFKDTLYLILGQDYNGKYDLMVNNQTGEISTFNHDTMKLRKLCGSLSEFLYWRFLNK